jgi:competence protein ComEA
MNASRFFIRSLAALSLFAAATGLAAAQTPQPSAPAAKTAPAPKAAPTKPPAAALLDINAATIEELDALPGIGAARAEAIVKGRPYKGKDELWQKNILPRAVYDKIKDKIVARQH